MTAIDKAREVADRLRAENAEKEEKTLAAEKDAIRQLDTLRQNPNLAKMYADNAALGADNLGGSLPLLKVHAVGKSTKNELADGSEPKDGWFFYKPTGEEFEEISCHILTISKGFKAPGLTDGKEVFNQIAGGIFNDGGEYKPFLLYLTGLKLSYMWEFGKEAAKYTRGKPPIPMFVLTVKLTTEKIANSYGKSWIINFTIEKAGNGELKLVLDEGEFQFLKDSVSEMEEKIAMLIQKKISGNQAEESTPVQKGEYRPDPAPDDIAF